MKNIIIYFLLITPAFLNAQTTPQWLFPIWFEDANGDKDTVYIGYDPSAGISNTFDEEFEDYIWIDTSKFNVGVNFSPSPYTGLTHPDSIKEYEVTSSLFFSVYINFIKGQMPITMYWEQSLFYSNDLPYPNLSPYPNAVAQVYCAAGEPGYINCPSAFDEDPLTMTDSVNIYYQYPINSSFVFEGSGNPPYNYPSILESFEVDFKPYEIYNPISDFMADSPEITPNPCNDFIRVQSVNDITQVSLYNNLGQLEKTINNVHSNRMNVNTSDLPNGVYYLVIESNLKIFSSFILKL